MSENRQHTTLKKRMMKKMAVLLMISLIISTAVSLIFSFAMTRKRILDEEQAKLAYLAQQYQATLEDISSFAKYIAGDEEIGEILQQGEGKTAFENVKYRDTLQRKLVRFNSMRTYVWCTFIELDSGKQYGSRELVEEDYYQKKFETIPEMKAFREDSNLRCSSPYVVEDQLKPGKVICFRQEIWDTTQYGQRMGTIYLEVYERLFQETIQKSDLEQVALYAADGNEIYQRGMEDRGTVLTYSVDSMGWTLKSIVTLGDIVSRCSAIILFFLISFVLSVSLIMYFTNQLMSGFTDPITKLAHQMRHTDETTTAYSETVDTGDEVEVLYESYKGMLDSIQKGMQERLMLKEQTKDAEFAILMSQIHPHYLYNVLNTVVYLSAAGRNQDVGIITHALIDTLQDTLGWGSGKQMASVEKELKLLENYITIQTYRFIGRFKIHVDCPQELKNCMVPKTIIQPLVDNALMHGIMASEAENGSIEVTILQDELEKGDEILKIVVADDGVGIAAERIRQFEEGEVIQAENRERKHIGLGNIKERIEYLYGAPYGIAICRRKETEGTLVTVVLPLVKEVESAAAKTQV